MSSAPTRKNEKSRAPVTESSMSHAPLRDYPMSHSGLSALQLVEVLTGCHKSCIDICGDVMITIHLHYSKPSRDLEHRQRSGSEIGLFSREQ